MGCGRFTISCRIKLGIFLKIPFIINILGFACHIFLLPVHQMFHFAFIFVFQFSSVQSLSRVWLFVTPWISARQASLSIANSQSLLKFMSIELVMPPSHLIFCHPLLLLAPNPSQHQGLFQWVNSSHEVTKTLEFQLSIFVFTMVQICKNNL